ncbi:GntR family transcriptional regulator [Streptacidiphilus monticola]
MSSSSALRRWGGDYQARPGPTPPAGRRRERRPGHPLSSERDLAVELGVSRPTVRAAIEELTEAGVLVRRHGRGRSPARAR